MKWSRVESDWIPRVLAVLMCVAACAQTPSPPVERLDPWTAGTLEIHQISTGRGNSAFFIFPDGTTLLVDAGAAADGLPETDPHPNGSRSPGAWIGRYISRHIPAGSAGLDYALITHFHPDHMGQNQSVVASLRRRYLSPVWNHRGGCGIADSHSDRPRLAGLYVSGSFQGPDHGELPEISGNEDPRRHASRTLPGRRHKPNSTAERCFPISYVRDSQHNRKRPDMDWRGRILPPNLSAP
jgi:hypothetical protein